MCGGGVGVGGGVGDCSPLYFIYRSPKEEDYVALWPSADSCRGKKAKTCRCRKMFRLGGGVAPLPPASYAYARECQEFFFTNIV